MPNVTRILLRAGASAASLGASALDMAAGGLRRLAEDTPSPTPTTEVPVEHRDEARRFEPVVSPADVPSNPAAPAGGDPDGTSGTGPVPRRISNPKAARKVRKRSQAASGVKRLEAKGGAKGAKPSTTDATEPTPAELAKSGTGRQAAPMGSSSSNQR